MKMAVYLAQIVLVTWQILMYFHYIITEDILDLRIFLRFECLMLNIELIIYLCHIFNVYTGNASSYFCNVIDVTDHSHSTRSQSHFILSHVKSQGQKPFKFNGIKRWNQLPSNIRSCDRKDTFKKQLKQELMLKMKNEKDCDFVC